MATAGHIRKRGERYQAIVYAGTTPDGKKRYLSKTAPTRAEARHELILLLHQVGQSKKGTLTDDSVLGVLGEWLSQSSIRGTTRKAHEWGMSKLGDIGAIPARRLTREDVQGLVASLQASGLSQASVKRVHATLSAGLSWAVLNGKVPTNVAKTVKVSPGVSRVKTPSLDQVKAFLAVLEQRKDFVPMLARFLIETGCRAGEACALTWDRVEDLPSGAYVITIDRTITKDDQGRYVVGTDTKTNRSRNIIVEATALPPRSDGFVFAKRGDTFTRPDFLTAAFSACWDRVAPNRDFDPVHGLRHFVATMLANDPSVSATTIKQRLGWSTTRMLDRYSHGLQSEDARVAKFLSGLMGGEDGQGSVNKDQAQP